MSSKSFKVSFNIDAEDAAYFRGLFRKAKKGASQEDPDEVLAAAKELVESVRKSKKTPNFVIEAIEQLEDLTAIIEDPDWRPPKSVASEVIGALAYFSNPEDLIPDQIPVLGFLDDAIMIKFVEDEFKRELAGYRKFRKFRDGAEQRPWTKVAGDRLPARLEARRASIRAEIDKGKARDKEKGKSFF